MRKRKKLVILTVMFCGLALIVAGAASAGFGVVGDDPTETTESTTTTLPLDTTEEPPLTEEPPTTDTTLGPDSEDPEEPGEDEGTFGDIISALRAAGDHTPAAIIMGKDVPGWDAEKHPGSVTDTTAYPPGQDKSDDGGDDEVGSDGTSDQQGGNSHSQNARGHKK